MSEKLLPNAASLLLDYIRKNQLKPGDMLPPENVLTGELQISRVALREGLIYLKAVNLLQSRRGSGYRIQSGSLTNALSTIMHALIRSALTDIHELSSLRCILETGAIADAVNNATEADIQELFAALQEMENITEVDSDETAARYNLAELRFHRAMLRPAGCEVLEIINQALEDFFNYRSELEPRPIRMSAESTRKTNREHRALAEAFAVGESSAVMLMLRNHLS